MFAVPGWAVSPTSLVQQKSPSNDRRSGSGSTKSGNSKKRKRNHENGDEHGKLSGSDLGKLWDLTFGQTDQQATSISVQIVGKQDQNDDVRIASETKPKLEQERSKTQNAKSNHKKVQSGTSSSAAPAAQVFDKSMTTLTSAEPHRPKSTKRVKNERLLREGTIKSASPAQSILNLSPQPASTSNLTPLQAKMRNKLTSARFRHLNQTLYTSSSADALELFKMSPDLFAEYHNGFSQQVKDSWPQNPVVEYIQQIKNRGVSQQHPLPRRKTGSCTVADLGCGDAPLARGCQAQVKALKLKFHSYDLHAPNSHVTVADISNLLLRDGEADIAVFCLSLMGTNWISFVEEAWRILRGDGKGEVWVAEVKSRFGRVKKGRVVDNSVGKKRKVQKPKNQQEGTEGTVNGEELFAEDETMDDTSAGETDISAFVKVFQRRGFQLQPDSVQKGNKMFVSMSFIKSGIPTAGKHKGLRWNGKEYQKTHDGRMRFVSGDQDGQETSPEEEAKVLKPCVYKTR